MSGQYINLNLFIAKDDKNDSFVSTIKDNGGEIKASHSFKYHPDNILLSSLEDKSQLNINQKSEQILNFGRELFNTVFGGEICGYYKSQIAGDSDIRLRLIFPVDCPEFLRLPWEFLHDGENYIAAFPRITLTRMLEGVSSDRTAPIEGKLKILAIVSSPLDLKDHERLQVEQEQLLIMKAVDRVHSANKVEIEFLDEASMKQIKDRLDEEDFHIIHYTGHGAYSNSEHKGYLILEDDTGKTRRVDNNEFADLLAGYKSIRLVVLSGCQTARTSGHRAFSDLATPLLKKKIPAVVAMQYSVTDQSAIELAQKLYTEIGNGAQIDMALTRARRELLINGDIGKIEFATPVLFASQLDCLEMKDTQATADTGFGKKISIKPNIMLALEQLGGQFVGRRRELRRIKDDFFARGIRVVMLHGIGGIGKTVIATKVAERLRDNFDGIYAFDCREELSPDKIIMRMNDYLKPRGVRDFDKYATAPIKIEEKINILAQLLNQIKLLLIFDNFESVLADEKNMSEIKDDGLKISLKQLINSCSEGTKFIFTSRYTFNLTDGRMTNLIDEINLGEMSRPEAIMVMNRFPDIAKEDFAAKLKIYEKIGGHPYTINLFGKHANQTSVVDVLNSLEMITKEMIEFTLLDRSYEKLTGSSRNLINQSAVLRMPISFAGLQKLMNDKSSEPDLTEEIAELIHWGMIIKLENETEEASFQVHTLVKEFIQQNCNEEQWRAWLINAADYYYKIAEESSDINIDFEARELYLIADEFEKAGVIVANITEYLYRWGYINLAASLNQQTIDTTEGLVKAKAFLNLGIMFQAIGEYDKAFEKYNESLRLSQEIEDKSGIALTLGQMGTLYYLQGKYGKASDNYNNALEIFVEFGERSGIADTLHQLGNIYYDQDEYEKALEKYNESLSIEKEIGNKSGIASTLGQMGRIYQAKNDYLKALKNYIISYSIFTKLKSPDQQIVQNNITGLSEELGEDAFKKLYNKAIDELKQEGYSDEFEDD